MSRDNLAMNDRNAFSPIRAEEMAASARALGPFLLKPLADPKRANRTMGVRTRETLSQAKMAALSVPVWAARWEQA
jgi:hypothetical protein